MQIVVRAKPGSGKVSKGSKYGLVEEVLEKEWTGKCPEYQVYVSAKAIDGAANKSIILSLAEYFKVSKSNVVLKKGRTSKIKIFEIG
ncbi:MAG: DUF167 family protein [Candidatus Ancillula sp.]|jgi:uncharacterized protein YggU (UPF0235/DUF167 family)|nr:DUF167 family protein [Candidatus Ancillula sp.]